MVAIDRSWCEALEEQREIERLARDPGVAQRRRVAGPVRVVTLLALVLAAYGFVHAVSRYGVGAAVALAWLLPMLVLGVILGAERLLVQFTRK